MAGLLRLQQYAGRLKGLLSAAQARSPQQAEGADSSGAVRMVLGLDGLPAAIRVSPDWERKIAPAAFGGAVLEAFHAAARERMAVWTQALKDGGWPSEVAQIQAEVDGPGTGATTTTVPPASVPAAFRRNSSGTSPRPLDVVAEDVLKAFGMVEQLTPAKPVEGIGKSASGKLVLRLAATGVVSCEADPRWVSHQTAVRLTEALNQALAAARSRLADAARAAQSAADQRSAGLGRLFGEALAMLEDPRRLSE